ncbi:MAG: hypothetical protein EOO73_16340 [Myxococcales bacterium]|nr:MAG: hypothetical protein EOO73_16340 [Myxococcales bacterium]
MNPVVVHVVRPYASEQEYLAAEAWSIDARGMLLVDAEPLAPDTAVLFDIALADGSKPIRAEGRVTIVVAPHGDRPGGLRVRFKRFGAATKAFIERAVKAKTDADRPSQTDAERPSQTDAERPSQTDAERPSLLDLERVSLPEVRQSMTDLEAVVAPSAPPFFAPPPPPLESSVRERIPGPIAAPANREELLARLRDRKRAS